MGERSKPLFSTFGNIAPTLLSTNTTFAYNTAKNCAALGTSFGGYICVTFLIHIQILPKLHKILPLGKVSNIHLHIILL